jgi:hypothetical protein
VKRIDESWHRLREWTYGQAQSERLAAQILLAEGFTDVDPSHPLGGRDGGRDAIARRVGVTWLVAVYFPRGQQSFGRIEKKLLQDASRIADNGAAGLVFVTNQELSLAQRSTLAGSLSVPLELYHLERVAMLIDQPTVYGVREQFLGIPASGDAPLHGVPPRIDELENELRESLRSEFGFLSTRGLPRDLRRGEPRLPMDAVFVPLRVEPPVDRAVIGEVLEHLSYRERRVIELRLGLANEYPRTLHEVGRTFNITIERVRQIEAQALEVCRELLRRRGAAVAALGLNRERTKQLISAVSRGMRINDLLDVQRLVVLGGPGSGKSTLTRYLTWGAATSSPALPESACTALPVRLASSELADALPPGPVDLFEIVMRRAGRFAPALQAAADAGRLLLIIDGLDEVTVPALADKLQKALNRFLADPARAGVSVLLTSRVVGFHPEGPLAELPSVMLAPLNAAEVKSFLAAWFAQLDGVDASAMTDSLMRRLRDDERMSELAGNPMLLTVLALLQARTLRLPNERAQLYAAATETLLHSWPLEQRGSELSYDTVPRWLAPLARKVFLSPPGRGVPEEDVVEILTSSWQSQFGGPAGTARQETRRLLGALRDDSGLLSVTGHSQEGARLWDFLHRSFAEYLVARELADGHMYRDEDPLVLAHEEAWQEAILMTFGELGRRRVELVGPLLLRLTAIGSTPWESVLRHDLKLALCVLDRDVPCDAQHAQKLLDAALDSWSTTTLEPLRQDLSAMLAGLTRTRYAGLLAERAGLLLATREQQLRIGVVLSGPEQHSLLRALLDRTDGVADEAAIALLTEASDKQALAYLRKRLPELNGPSGVRAAEQVARWAPALGIDELARRVRAESPAVAEQAAHSLARQKGRTAIAAMEGLLDLEREPRLEPVLERLAQAGVSARRRLLTLAESNDPQRFGALLVLRRMRVRQADRIVERLAKDKDGETRRRAAELTNPRLAEDAEGESPSQDEDLGVQPTIAAMLDGTLELDAGLDALAAREWPELKPSTLALLRRKKLAARRLGARLLAVTADSRASNHADELIDDPDPTVRCAAIWTLIRTGEHLELLLALVDRLIFDVQPIEGPPLRDAYGLHLGSQRSVRCCADAIYCLLEGSPALLASASTSVPGGTP